MSDVLVDQLRFVVVLCEIARELGRVGLRRAGRGSRDVLGLLACDPLVEGLAVTLLLGGGAVVDRRPGRVVRRRQPLLWIARDHLLGQWSFQIRHALVVEGALGRRVTATHSPPVSTPTLSSTSLPTSWAWPNGC